MDEHDEQPPSSPYWDGRQWWDWNGQQWVARPPAAAPVQPDVIVTQVAPVTYTDQRANPGQTVIAWILTVLSLGYFLPWAIAATRGKSNSGAVGWINFLLGWTIIGWFVALFMALGAHNHMRAE